LIEERHFVAEKGVIIDLFLGGGLVLVVVDVVLCLKRLWVAEKTAVRRDEVEYE